MGLRLDGKIAIVAGGGRGIGAGIARVFAAQGAIVLVADASEKWARECVERIEQNGGIASSVVADVSREEDMAAMAATALEMYGRIDILCHNAGLLGPMVSLEDMKPADWDRMLGVNLRGVFLSVTACLPQMLSQRYGRIVITSSTTGNRTAIVGLSHYASAKGGINGFIRNAALELADRGITVNGVEPGNIVTEGMLEMPGGDEYARENAAVIPMGHLGDPEDIGWAMAFLASDEAKFITGQTIVVDGGQILAESAFGRAS